MSDLKTLKEIESYCEGCNRKASELKNIPKTAKACCPDNSYIYVKKWELRQEAIKWIKCILEVDEEDLNSALSRNSRVSWIKKFFNITDEELK